MARIALEPTAPEPGRDFAISFQRREHRTTESLLRVNQNAVMFSQMSKLVWLYLVFVLLVVIAAVHALRKAPTPLDDLLLAKKIGAFNRSCFVRCFENHSITQVEREHSCFLLPQWWNEGCGRLRGGDNRGLRLAHHVNAVVIAHAVFTGRHKTLRFVGPKNQQVCIRSFLLLSVEPAQHMRVKEHFEKGVDITALGLKFLRHCYADDF